MNHIEGNVPLLRPLAVPPAAGFPTVVASTCDAEGHGESASNRNGSSSARPRHSGHRTAEGLTGAVGSRSSPGQLSNGRQQTAVAIALFACQMDERRPRCV